MGGSSRARAWPAKLLLAALALGASLLLAEAVWRARRGDARDEAGAREHLRGVAQQAATNLPGQGVPEDARDDEWRTGLHPFLAFDALHSLTQVRRDELYFRTPQAESDLEIVVLGGSVAASFGFQGGPALATRLERAPALRGRGVRVLTYARAAHKQPQQTIALAYLLSLGIRPDAVLNLDGFNEVAQSKVNVGFDTNPAYPSIAQWAPYVGGAGGPDEVDLLLEVRATQRTVRDRAERWADSPLLASALARDLALRLVDRARRGMVAAQDRYLESRRESPFLRGPEFDRDRDAVIGRGVQLWAEGSRSLQALCASRGILYVHALQPTLHDGAKTPTAEELASGTASRDWLEAVEHGYPRLRAAGAALRAEGIDFVDLTDVFAGEAGTIYVDACHVNARGNDLMARRLARALRSRLGDPDGPEDDASADEPR